MAETFRQFADRLEKAEDFTSELNTLIRETITEHERIIFNGNGYDESWTKEAAKRGLSNYPSTADCLPHLMDEKNVRLFERHGVYSETELRARRDILLESYCKQINIEAQVMLEMIHRDIVPAVISFEKTLADTINAKAQIKIESKAETKLLGSVSGLLEQLYDNCQALEEAAAGVKLKNCDLQSMAVYCHESVIPAMNALRVVADKLECLVSKDLWPYPSYGRLLYRV